MSGDISKHEVLVISNNFHTGIIIELNEETRKMLVFSKFFEQYRYADIGWGEEFFYQDPDFSYSNASRALLLPSKSVVRVEGFNADLQDLVTWSNRAMKITLTRNGFTRLCGFINSSFTKDYDGNFIIVSRRGNGEVIFFKSPSTYHLFNTCNTWVASAFHQAGIGISPLCALTADILFRRLKDKGEVLK